MRMMTSLEVKAARCITFERFRTNHRKKKPMHLTLQQTVRRAKDCASPNQIRSAHVNTAGRMLSHDLHFGQRQYQPMLCSPQSSQ